MSDLKILVKGSILGRILYKVSGRKILNYKEDLPDYVVPEKYLSKDYPPNQEQNVGFDSSKATLSDEGSSLKEKNNFIIVAFDGEDDPEDPRNWSWFVRIFTGLFAALLSGFTYVAASSYLAGQEQLQEEFGIDHVKGLLPLSVFVLGYGIGPMIFSPLSEHPAIGRNKIYVLTLLVFAILQVPTALAKNLASLCVLRLIGGIFVSPVLAIGGATFSDMYKGPYIPIGVSIWGIGSYSGVALGPLIGAALQERTNTWRWSFWFLAICSGALALIFFTIIPETYQQSILHRKVQRLQRLTGNPNLVVQQNLAHRGRPLRKTLVEILWRPIEITLIEPVVILINIYIPLLYAIMYLWFEAVPFYYIDSLHFLPVPASATYLAMLVGVIIGDIIYCSLILKYFTHPLLRSEKVYPEVFIPIAILGSVILPIGMLIFGWSATTDHHWFGSLVGIALYGTAGIILFQTLLNYIAMSFPNYIASAFASNAFMRSIIGGFFPLFGKSMFKNLATDKYPVAWGSTILGGICIALIAIPVLFYLNGPKLRATSRYAGLNA